MAASTATSNGRKLTLAALATAKGLPADFLRNLGLCDLPQGGVGIPYYGLTGEEVAVKRRTALKAKDGSYWPAGTPLTAYGQWRLDAAVKAGFLILVEGESDCWALWSQGLPALGLPGSNTTKTLLREHVEAIATVYVHREPDAGGEAFGRGAADRLAALGFRGKVFELRMPAGVKDPAELYATDPEGFTAALEKCIRAATPILLGDRAEGDGAAGRRFGAHPSPPPWPEPAPLYEVPEAPPFPLDVLPDPLVRYVKEVSAALPCPPDYVAVPLLAMAGAAVGASRAVAVKKGHVQRAALYAAVIGPPGSAKTPALELVVEPAHDLGEQLHARWEGSMAEYARRTAEYEEAVKEAKRSKGERPDKPERPPLPRLTVNDATAESLVPILKENPRGVALVRDELIGWVQSMNQYREVGKGADQQFWLSAWSGATVEVDRKKTHDLGPLRVRKPFIAVVGGLTPDKLPTLRGDRPRQRAEQDGFIDRILMTYPQETPASEENWMEVAEETRRLWHDAFLKLRTLAMVPVQEGATIKGHRPFLVKLTGDARAWQGFTRRHADERNGEDFPAHLIGPWSKLRGYCARLALIVRLLCWACGETDDAEGDGDVDGESMGRAARLVAYFMGHTRKVYAAADADPRAPVARKLAGWIVKGERRTFDRRNAYRACRGPHCKTVADIDPVLELLEQHGYVRPTGASERPGPGRKPAPVYEANPAIFGQNGHNGHNGDPEGREDERGGNSVHSVHSVQGSQEEDDVNPPGKGDAWVGE